MLHASYTLPEFPHLTGRINVAQLAQVEAEHMPCHAVHFAAEAELVRVGLEVAAAKPHFADEAAYVVKKELHRRAVKMSISC